MRIPTRSRAIPLTALGRSYIPCFPVLYPRFPKPQSIAPPHTRRYQTTDSTTPILVPMKDSPLTEVTDPEETSDVPKKKVIVLWDLDNKPPTNSKPYETVQHLRAFASKFGEVVSIAAFANQHAFTYVPKVIREERRELKELHRLEKARIFMPTEPYVCGVCGAKQKTHLKLLQHFKQLHERQRNKVFAGAERFRSQQKRQRYLAKVLPEEKRNKYYEAAKGVIVPKHGYNLAPELKRAGINVQLVSTKSQAADAALMKYAFKMRTKGNSYDWMILISDDDDFTELLREAMLMGIGTIIFSQFHRRKRISGRSCVVLPWDAICDGTMDSSTILKATVESEKPDDQVLEDFVESKRRDVMGLFGIKNEDFISA